MFSTVRIKADQQVCSEKLLSLASYWAGSEGDEGGEGDEGEGDEVQQMVLYFICFGF